MGILSDTALYFFIDAEPIAATATFSQGNISGVIRFEQESYDSPVEIKGEIKGLDPGNHGFHVHELPFENDDCLTAGSHFNPFNVIYLFNLGL